MGLDSWEVATWDVREKREATRSRRVSTYLASSLKLPVHVRALSTLTLPILHVQSSIVPALPDAVLHHYVLLSTVYVSSWQVFGVSLGQHTAASSSTFYSHTQPRSFTSTHTPFTAVSYH